MNKLSHLIRPDLRKFNAYRSARDEAKHGKIWLNANESPYDDELQDHVLINRYPEKQPKKLIKELALMYQVEEKQIVLSRGSDEAIDLLTRLFCIAGKDAIMTCPPTFGMYSVYAQLQGASVIEIPLSKESGYQLNVSSILSGWEPHVKIIFLCSPNNPTGNLLKHEDILYLCNHFSNKSIIVVDEAYIEYADEKSLSGYINQYDNLVILRTLSKAYGLAGIRCGLLLAQENLVQWIMKIMAPYPLPSLTITTIAKKISPHQLRQVHQQIEDVKSQRKYLFNALKKMSFVKRVLPSAANFLLIEMDNAQKIMNECENHGIIIRSMRGKLGIENCVRISIGLPDENMQLINVLKKVQ